MVADNALSSPHTDSLAKAAAQDLFRKWGHGFSYFAEMYFPQKIMQSSKVS
jgi:hypothetical protein